MSKKKQKKNKVEPIKKTEYFPWTGLSAWRPTPLLFLDFSTWVIETHQDSKAECFFHQVASWLLGFTSISGKDSKWASPSETEVLLLMHQNKIQSLHLNAAFNIPLEADKLLMTPVCLKNSKSFFSALF